MMSLETTSQGAKDVEEGMNVFQRKARSWWHDRLEARREAFARDFADECASFALEPIDARGAEADTGEGFFGQPSECERKRGFDEIEADLRLGLERSVDGDGHGSS